MTWRNCILAVGVAATVADAATIEEAALQYKYCHGTGAITKHMGNPLPCFSTWEAEYMKEHADELEGGLRALHAPGCFPHGRYIVAAGYYRTGSTLLFNTARLWVALGAGENMMAGWGCPDKDSLELTRGDESTPPRTAVCKLHEMKKDAAKSADVVLMSHRDPYHSICSRKMEHMWCKSDPFYNGRFVGNKDPLYDEAKEACFNGDEKMEVQGQCQLLMGLQADVYARREAADREVAYDVPLEGWQANAQHHIKNVGAAIGICDEAVHNKPLLEFIHQMGLYLGAKASHSKEQGLTKMHEVHLDAERDQACGNVRAGIASSPECEAWFQHNGSYAANGILNFLRKCKENKKDCGIGCLQGHWYQKVNPARDSRDYKLVSGVSECDP